MKITILAVGKIKERFFSDAIYEYCKRLSGYCSLELIEVGDESTPEKASAVQKERIRGREGERILSRIKKSSYVVTLEIDGETMDSVEFSGMMQECMVRGIKHLVFIVGGSLGLSRAVRERADRTVSFSKMTFPHQLMRVILLEQIYRGFKIMKGEPYHK